MNNKIEGPKIDLKDGLDVAKAEQINKLANEKPKDFGDALQKQIEGIQDKKGLAQDILTGMDKGKDKLDVSQLSTFKTLLDNIAQLDPDIKNSADFKKRASIVNSEDNFNLWKNITSADNLKKIVDDKKIETTIKNLKPVDSDLKSNLDGIYKKYQKNVAAREKNIQELPLNQLIAYGITYDKSSGELRKENETGISLFKIDTKTQDREFDIKIIQKDNAKISIQLNKDKKIEGEITQSPAILDNQTIKQYIGLMQIQNNIQGLDYTKIKTYIDTIPHPDKEEKNDFLTLITEAKRLNPTDGTKYDALIEEINKTQTKESQEKTNKDIDTQAMEIINQKPTIETAKKLFDNGENRGVTNKILEMTKNGRQNLSAEQKDNITNIIKIYISGQYKEIASKLEYKDIQDSIKIGKDLPHRPETYNGLPVYLIQIQKPGNPITYIEIFPGTEKDIHTARSQKIDKVRIVQGDNLQPYEAYDKDKNTIDLRKLGNGVNINQFITGAHEAGSYVTLEKILKEQTTVQGYLKNNLSTVLEGIKNTHKTIADSTKENTTDHTNGYYRVIAESIINTGDKGTIKAYLTHIQSTPSYLGDGQSRIDTRNIIGKRGDANILKSTDPADKELQNLFLLVKAQIDPTKAKGDILEQVDANLDKFMETFGPTIAMVVDFLGGKGTFMKMLPAAMRDKFKENFKKNNEMKGKEGERFDVISNALENSNISKDKINKDPEEIIKEVQDGAEGSKIKNLLEINFTSLSPTLVYNIIKQYNKNKKPEDQIKPEDVITFNTKGAPESVKNNLDHKGKIVAELLNKTSPMWKDIKGAHKHAQDNSQVDFRTEKEKEKGSNPEIDNINGSETNKSIGSYADVAIYIAAYVTTAGGNTPYHHVISENDKVTTSKSHKEGKALDKPYEEQKKLEEEYKQKINTITTEINKKDGNIIPTSFDVSKINTDKSTETYVNTILKPLEESLSQSIFKLTADNADLLTALQSKSQVMKDFVSYIANTKQGDEKTTLQGIADIFKTSDNQLTSIQTIEKSKDATSIIITVNNKKISISAGPTITEYKEQQEKDTKAKEITIPFIEGKGDMINTKSHKELFTKDEQGNRSPNIDEIKKFYAGKNKEVTGIFPSQTYEPSGDLTGFARNKGEHAGQFKDIDKLKTAGLGILIKDETGKLTLSHTDEINNRTTIPNDKDIITLPSVKRNGKFNEDILGKSDIAHFIVQKVGGAIELITTYGNKEAQKKSLENPSYERVLYLDVKGNNNQLNGYRAEKDGKLAYGHHTNGDILNNAAAPKEVVKGNMPALIVMTKDKPSS